MPYEISTDESNGIVRVTLRGEISLEDMMAILEQIAPEGHYTSNKRLWDVRSTTSTITGDHLQRFADAGRSRDTDEPARVAVVASEDFQFGMSRLHEVYRTSETLTQRAFRSPDEAVAWLEEWDPDSPTGDQQ